MRGLVNPFDFYKSFRSVMARERYLGITDETITIKAFSVGGEWMLKIPRLSSHIDSDDMH